jgi:hypothetical protein
MALSSTGGESGDLLVPSMEPANASIAADGIGDAIQAVTHYTVDALHPGLL